MGPRPDTDLRRVVRTEARPYTIVYSTAKGSNVLDVDGNRYVDLAAGFGSLLLGHSHPRITKVIELQTGRLLQALGDVYPSEPKVALMERLGTLRKPMRSSPGEPQPIEANVDKVILCQSGADAVTAALKSAILHTKKSGLLAFDGAYHGLSYAPLAACGLRESYRAPFAASLGDQTRFVSYPATDAELEPCLERIRFELARGDVAAVLFEPILGRGGCLVPPPDFVQELLKMCRSAGALTIADEVWTGLGRAGAMLTSESEADGPDLICLGKGLGGGLPISACLGRGDILDSWSQTEEVVHTSTFAGAPLACVTAIATLDILHRDNLAERSRDVGGELLRLLRERFLGREKVRDVRGRGLMLGIDFGDERGSAVQVMRRLLERGFITTTGGGQREALILSPPLNIAEPLLHAFADALDEAL